MANVYKGLHSKEDTAIANMASVRMENIAFLQQVDLEDIEYKTLQVVRDMLEQEDKYKCPSCEQKEEATKDVAFEFDQFIEELRYEFDKLRDEIPRNNKGLVEQMNQFIERVGKEFQKRKKKCEDLSSHDFEYTFDPDQLQYESES